MKKALFLFVALLMSAALVCAAILPVGFDKLMSSGAKNEDSVKLCYKDNDGPNNIPCDADDWTCELIPSLAGIPNIKVMGSEKHKIMNYDRFTSYVTLYGLKANTQYQVKLNSYGPGFEADSFANACPAPGAGPAWQCGYWGGEGFLVLGTLTSNSMGTITAQLQSYPLPEGVYRARFLVTENVSPWNTPLMEERQVEFVIVSTVIPSG